MQYRLLSLLFSAFPMFNCLHMDPVISFPNYSQLYTTVVGLGEIQSSSGRNCQIQSSLFFNNPDTLDRFPDTLLGNKEMRQQFYNPKNEEIFLTRNSEAFEAILFYYQSNGILGRLSFFVNRFSAADRLGH